MRDQIKQGPIDETRVSVAGPDVSLDVRIVPQVAMMLHELGTNSIKYGALSSPAGKINISWTVRNNELHLLWKESGGPAVAIPFKRGFGTTLIEQSARGAGGNAHMVMDAAGITWDIRILIPQLNPLKTGEAPASNAKHLLPSSAGKVGQTLAGKRFLIVEDEPLVAMDLVDLLTSAGAEVVGSTGDALEALQLIEATVPHGVLLDANLFGRPVDDIAAALTRKGLPFAFVSGYGRASLPAAFKMAPLLPKPYTAEQILECAGQLVANRDDVVRLKRQ